MRMLALTFLLAGCLLLPHLMADEPQLTGQSSKLFELNRKDAQWFRDAMNLQPEVATTSDGRSFMLIWKASKSPSKWIVSLHGAGKPARGFASDDLAIWHRHIKDRDVGIICLQWWLGTGDLAKDFLNPQSMYREFDLALQKLEVKPGQVMLHGFSRGSANTYPIAALDHGRGKKYFGLCVASSGGVSLDYPPTRAIMQGEYGNKPLSSTRWITVAGARDQNAGRDGITGMRTTAQWLKEQGAEVLLQIEDPREGHGALVRNPANAAKVLDTFLKQ